MDRVELERLLRKWGRWFGQLPPREWDEDSSQGVGMLTGVLLQRMRVGVAAVGVEPVLAERTIRGPHGEAVTIRQAFTAKGKQSEGGERPWLPDLEAEGVEVAALHLYRYDRMRAVVLRCDYCLYGPRREVKLPVAQKCLDFPKLGMRRYRMELDLAKEWMAGAIFGKRNVA